MNATTYAPTLRRLLRRRPSTIDRLRASLARALAILAARIYPTPSPRRATDLWND